MTVVEFIASTQQIIAEDGLESYLPTVIVETSKQLRIAVLQDDAPPGTDIDSFAKDWARTASGAKNDYFLAFRVDATHFKVVCRQAGVIQEQVVEVD